jgi:hypothetical protein
VDRHAIFVDVGYVIAAVGELVAGSTDRAAVTCDYYLFVRELHERVAVESGLPLLRTYWYDASLSGTPEFDQEKVADLPGVRLRLGRLVRGEQKGVDSRLVRDLIVLARDRALVEAYLVAGDEDLAEGVQEAQDAGVRVVLLGVPGLNQSKLLQQQVDKAEVYEEDWWRHYFSSKVIPVPTNGSGKPVPAAITGPVNPVMQAAMEKAGGAALIAETTEYTVKARAAGAAFAREFREKISPPELRRYQQTTGWYVPVEVDPELLRFADRQLEGRLWERPELKYEVRNGFWEELRHG